MLIHNTIPTDADYPDTMLAVNFLHHLKGGGAA